MKLHSRMISKTHELILDINVIFLASWFWWMSNIKKKKYWQILYFTFYKSLAINVENNVIFCFPFNIKLWTFGKIPNSWISILLTNFSAEITKTSLIHGIFSTTFVTRLFFLFAMQDLNTMECIIKKISQIQSLINLRCL